ncbi:MAG TPA: hypothetical protein VME22_24545 [Solirubrobacteraceae bacterium]|nr:hypothetical protein [Solirubrobacteraceae bacterium]
MTIIAAIEIRATFYRTCRIDHYGSGGGPSAPAPDNRCRDFGWPEQYP